MCLGIKHLRCISKKIKKLQYNTLENKERLCYADTDSIHLTGLSNQEMNSEYPMSFCYWVGGATMSNLTKE